MRITIINGPNLNLLGSREPEVYGSQSFEEYLVELKSTFPVHEIKYYQSNIEGELIDHLQQCDADGVLLNAGGYTHTSVAIADAITAVDIPVVEVHISNPLAREEYRHVSLVGQKCIGTVSGFGLNSYNLAMQALVESLS